MTKDYPFQCPSCGSHDLMISCEIACRVLQGGDGEFETEPDNNSDWYFDNRSIMTCQTCNHSAEVREFETTNTTEEQQS
jgi:predicted RNA-binding Zn-ribbon protein involved in translation (DUF1610 family)